MHKCFKNTCLRFFGAFLALILVGGCLPFGGGAYSVKAYATAKGNDIKQGDILRLQADSWEEDFIVLDPTRTNTKKDGMLLLQKDYDKETNLTNFETSGLSNVWEGSQAQKWCSQYYLKLPSSVRSAIIGVKTTETESGYDFAGINNIDGTGNGSKDKVFFLSYKEYIGNREAAGISTDKSWWLRSPGTDCHDLLVYVCVVTGDGEVHDFGAGDPEVDLRQLARPAFNIDLPEDVCATRSVTDGKTTWIVDMDHPDHDYETPAYTWNKDNSQCTASVSCAVCGAVITETVNTQATVIKATTADEAGEINYTATFGKAVFEKQEKTEITEHNYGAPVYTWAADNSTCTATSICSLCGETVTETVHATSVVIAKATVLEEGMIRFTAVFSKNLFDEQTKDVATDKLKIDEDGSTQLDIGDHVRLGNEHVAGYTGIPYWRVIDVDADGNALLLSEYLWIGDGTDPEELIQFNAVSSKKNGWQGSDAQAWCKAFETAVLDNVEGLTIKETTKSDAFFPSPDDAMIEFAQSTNILNRDKVFFLSAEEAVRYLPTPAERVAVLPEEIETDIYDDVYWWLRSPRDGYGHDECSGRVYSVGEIGKDFIIGKGAVRPAFWADLSNLCMPKTKEANGNVWTVNTKASAHQYGEIVPQEDPVCGSPGRKAHYRCSVCKGYFDEDRKRVEPSELTIDATAQHMFAFNEGQEATCTKDGCVPHWECTTCHKKFEDAAATTEISNVVKRHTGHQFKAASYAWAAGNKTCTATAKCQSCGEAVTEKVNVSSRVTKAATANATGETTYTATFKNALFKKQTRTASIAMKFAAGAKRTVGGSAYQVLSPKSLTVALIKANNVKNYTVPNTVRIQGKTCKVVQVNAKSLTGSRIRTVTLSANVQTLKPNAFTSSKATKIIARTKKLKKASVRNSLKSSRVGTVQVVVGNKKQNKAYVKTYKKIFTKGNAGKKATVK